MPGPDGYTMTMRRRIQRLARKVSPRDHSRGSPLARITLVAYGDFASPACAQTYRTIKKIQKKMGSELQYVYRSFPQPQNFPHSEEAAEAAECASSQGKFWEMHDSLFESGTVPDDVQLLNRASDAGLDVLRFRREMKSRVYADDVQATREGGVRSGVADAPTFFINSVRHESSFGLATLLAALQAASGDAPSPVETAVPAERKARGKR